MQHPEAHELPADHPKHSYVSPAQYQEFDYVDVFLDVHGYTGMLEHFGLGNSEISDLLELFVLPLPSAVAQMKNFVYISLNGWHNPDQLPFGNLDVTPAFPQGVLCQLEAIHFLQHCKQRGSLLQGARFQTGMSVREAVARNFMYCSYNPPRYESTLGHYGLTQTQTAELKKPLFVGIDAIPGWFTELMNGD